MGFDLIGRAMMGVFLVSRALKSFAPMCFAVIYWTFACDFLRKTSSLDMSESRFVCVFLCLECRVPGC